MNQVELLRHVADNLEAGLPAGHGMCCDGIPSAAISAEHIYLFMPGRYSLAPRTRLINGVEVPAPMDEAPGYDTKYWSESISSERFSMDGVWVGSRGDLMRLNRGQCYSTQEAAAANCRARYGIK